MATFLIALCYKYLMKSRLIHIIACFLFSLFVSKEVAADVKLIHAQKKEICKEDCESRSTEKSTEERSAEQEQKLLTETIHLPELICNLQFDQALYNIPFIPGVDLGIITPPPELS